MYNTHFSISQKSIDFLKTNNQACALLINLRNLFPAQQNQGTYYFLFSCTNITCYQLIHHVILYTPDAITVSVLGPLYLLQVQESVLCGYPKTSNECHTMCACARMCIQLLHSAQKVCVSAATTATREWSRRQYADEIRDQRGQCVLSLSTQMLKLFRK